MRNIVSISRRELGAYFTSPLAYVFIVMFLALSGGLTFYVGGFLERGQADLDAFFRFHPWLYLVLIPALGMRLWAEERKTGTIEFVMTLPVSTTQVVLAKFIAAWLFAGLVLALTFPLWITVNYLGTPDNGVILAAYIGSWLMAGAFLALSAFVSALTDNQVIAFVLAAGLSFVFLMSGVDLVQAAFRGWAPEVIVGAVASLSFLEHFHAIARGVIDLRDIVYFISLIAASLFINVYVVELKKAA
jgi:ABC-2 type transport system permease protein